MSSELENKLAEEIKSQFPNAEVKVQRKFRISLSIDKESIIEIARYLREIGFDQAVSVSGVDKIKENMFIVVYHIWSTSKKVLASLKTQVPRDNPNLPSLVKIFESVNWHEKETHEMFGINFEGHPDLGRLLLPEGWEGKFPLRKDFVK
ncbi:MAG TPA: NADH-quinone oxidoreductase subunit C [archaeon]|nr:NADH-quinone oxidoreductase subunit C [archaeon]